MLKQSVATVRRVEIQYLERPQAILEQLKQSYSKRHRISVEDVSLIKILKDVKFKLNL